MSVAARKTAPTSSDPPRSAETPVACALNRVVAERLREAAALLDEQAASPFRVRAYRRAADTVAELRRNVGEIVEGDGRAGLDALPGIGAGIAAAIDEMVRTGRWALLERLRGTTEPEALLRTVPGIGSVLSRRLHDVLHVDSLASLEVAAHDGRLAALPGVGPRRGAAIAAGLAARLGRSPGVRVRPPAEPPVELLLDVDHEYRARASQLPRIAPKRFNPTGERWLPVLHTERGLWQFTALHSNSARAHRLGRTHDWVVIYFHTDHQPEGQRTVVTESRGRLAGLRVVRGREAECGALLSRAVSGRRPGGSTGRTQSETASALP